MLAVERIFIETKHDLEFLFWNLIQLIGKFNIAEK